MAVELNARPSERLTHYGSDKDTVHRYGSMYDTLLAACPRVDVLLEIGLFKGASIRAWRDVFPQATIVGADIDRGCIFDVGPVEGFKFWHMDVSDGPLLEKVAKEMTESFDVIIDDSTHMECHQMNIRRTLFQSLTPGGVMVIEDVANDSVAAWMQEMGGCVWDNRKETGDCNSRAVSFRKGDDGQVVP